MKPIVVSSHPYSLKKVAQHIAEVIGADLYSIGDMPSTGRPAVLVSTVSEIDLAYMASYAMGSPKCVLYVVAEGVPLIDKRYPKFYNFRCIIATPSQYSKQMLEQAGFAVSEVVPHYIEYRDGQWRPWFVGTVAINLRRKGIEYVIETARRVPVLPFFFATTPTGEVEIKDIPPNMRFTTRLPTNMEYTVYLQSGLYYLPSLSEGFSLSPREYIATTGGYAVVTDLPVYGDEPGLIKCRTAKIETVEYRGQLVELRHPDVSDCVVKIAKYFGRISPGNREAMRQMYPKTLYLKFAELLDLKT